MESVGSEFWRESSAFPWPDEKGFDAPWLLSLHWAEIGGRMECVGFSLELKDPTARLTAEHIITATKLRNIPLGEYIDRGRVAKADVYARVAGILGQEGRPGEAKHTSTQGDRFKPKTKRGGPRVWNDDHYKEVAWVYTHGLQRGIGPTKYVMRIFSQQLARPVSHSTAARWVQRARALGFLGPTEERKAGGILPPETMEDEQ